LRGKKEGDFLVGGRGPGGGGKSFAWSGVKEGKKKSLLFRYRPRRGGGERFLQTFPEKRKGGETVVPIN